MANTVKVTNRTIEVSAIDESYMMDTGINVQSVVFIPGQADDVVNIVENSTETVDPTKVQLLCLTLEPRSMIFNQRLQLGFVFANGIFTANSKVIFNIGELR
jgi:hypothetical protein